MRIDPFVLSLSKHELDAQALHVTISIAADRREKHTCRKLKSYPSVQSSCSAR